jgi:hypothetical protein
MRAPPERVFIRLGGEGRRASGLAGLAAGWRILADSASKGLVENGELRIDADHRRELRADGRELG